jgi:hypothetical protein
MNAPQQNGTKPLPEPRLVDGPLLPVRRKTLVERMAKDLIRYDAVTPEADSIRSLFGRGYSMVDIVMLIDDARQVAMQAIVAREMSAP